MSTKRDRAWRRAQAARVPRRSKDRFGWKPEKKWSQIYLRSDKLNRARQVGIIWPAKERVKLMADAEPINVLFICSRNQWRSPTGEKVWSQVAGVSTRSAGTSKNARRQVKLADIWWADIIFVMEEKHAQRLRATYRQEMTHKQLHVLDIPDDYQFMDPELVDLIQAKAERIILA